MRNRDKNNEGIQKLEDEIRKLGIPYSSNEPEPLYWANFRVRVMDRIAAKEQKASWLANIGQFFAEHVLWAGIAVSAACLLVAAILWMQPSGASHLSGGGEAPRLAAVQQPATVSAPPAPAISQAIESHRTHWSDESYRPRDMAKIAKSIAQPTEDLASVAVPLGGDEDEPVGLQSLSKPELEAVLQGLQTNE